MCTVKGGKNWSNTFGEAWGTFPPTFPHPKGRIWRDLGGGAAGGDDVLFLWSGRSEGKKGRVGEKRPARALYIGLVAPSRVARQVGPRHHRHGHLSRQWSWRDKPTLSRHCVPKPSKACNLHLVAWQVVLVAPLPVARQISFVAPPAVARQSQNSVTLPCFCCCSALLLVLLCLASAAISMLLVLKLLTGQ